MFRRDRLIRKHLRERFIATLLNGDTFDGLLIEADSKTYRFTNTYAVDPQNNRLSVDGDLFLPRNEVAYLQKPGANQ